MPPTLAFRGSLSVGSIMRNRFGATCGVTVSVSRSRSPVHDDEGNRPFIVIYREVLGSTKSTKAARTAWPMAAGSLVFPSDDQLAVFLPTGPQA